MADYSKADVVDDAATAPLEALSLQVQNFYVRFRTETDDKDGGDTISGVIKRSDGTILAEQPEFGRRDHKWNDQTDQPDGGDGSWGGKPGWFLVPMKPGISVSDTETVTLTISKTGNKTWGARVMCLVRLSNGTDREVLSSKEKAWNDRGRDQSFPFSING